MKLNEAYETLNLNENSSDEEIKKKYRELSKKYHPDICKEPNAQEKMKNINEAYNILTGKTQPEQSPIYSDIPNINDIFSSMGINFPFNQGFNNNFNKKFYEPDVRFDANITFEQSILGTKTNLNYEVKDKCTSCNGNGHTRTNNCTSCNGIGVKIKKMNNVVVQTQCEVCNGRVTFNKCKNTKCDNGYINSKRSINVKIPEGVVNDSILRVSNCGNYNSHFDSYGDLFLHIKVKENKEYKLINNKDVSSELTISLMEAVRGTTKKINTVHGEKEIKINKLTKNNDKVILDNCGVLSRNGSHIVNININYPNLKYW